MNGANGFEESVIALKSMFPDLSEVVVRATLEARDGHMESAVEKLLAMSRRGSGNGSSAHGGGRNGGQEYGGARFGAPGAVGMSPSATGGRNGCVVVTSRHRDSMVERRACGARERGFDREGTRNGGEDYVRSNGAVAEGAEGRWWDEHGRSIEFGRSRWRAATRRGEVEWRTLERCGDDD